MKDHSIKTIREFNRFYTTYLGILDRNFLGSNYTLTEGRIIVEIGNSICLTAKEISNKLNIDQGHLSRIISSYIKAGIVKSTSSDSDKRYKILQLTKNGLSIYNELNSKSDQHLQQLLDSITEKDEIKLIESFLTISKILRKQKEFKAIACSFNDFKTEICNIRETVFIMEQNVPPELELDGLDPKCIHVIIKNKDKYLATGRIQMDGHIGRVAVLKEYRGLGLGKIVIKSLINVAREKGLKSVYLGAQLSAKKFYEKLKFVEYGDIFLDAGIEHINMKLKIK